MTGLIARAAVRVLFSMAAGALFGAVYAALVSTAHIVAYGRWAGIPAFAFGSILVGLALGLLGFVVWAVWGEAARKSAGGGSPPVRSRPSESARRPADEEGGGRRLRPVCLHDHAPGDVRAARPGSWSGLWRSFASPN
jgi:hypothetical protein